MLKQEEIVKNRPQYKSEYSELHPLTQLRTMKKSILNYRNKDPKSNKHQKKFEMIRLDT